MKARNTLGTLALVLTALLAAAPSAGAQAKPVWKLNAASQPTHFIPGSSGKGHLLVRATNIGAATTSGAITIADVLPAGHKRDGRRCGLPMIPPALISPAPLLRRR